MTVSEETARRVALALERLIRVLEAPRPPGVVPPIDSKTWRVTFVCTECGCELPDHALSCRWWRDMAAPA